MELHVIGTGSSGNAYLLKAGDSALLLDAGLPIKQIVRAVPDWKQLDGCLITHEHLDHSKAASAVATLGVKTYASAGTIQAITRNSALNAFEAVRNGFPFAVGKFSVMPFETQHDAAEPLGFLIRYDPTGELVLYATDTYYLRFTFPGVHYWIIECNYIQDFLGEDEDLSPALRTRLGRSHMSLLRLLDVLEANDLSKTRSIVLIHLSDERSDEKAMVGAVKQKTGIEDVVAASAGMTIPLELAPF